MSINGWENERAVKREHEWMRVRDDEINLLDCYRVIKKRRKLVAIIVGAATIVSVIYSLLAAKIYRSEAVIMPLGSGGGGVLAQMAAQFSGLPFMGALGGMADTKTQQFMTLLESRTLAEKIIERYGLMKVIFEDEWDNKNNRWEDQEEAPTMEEAVYRLKKRYMKFEDDKKSGIITISADFKDPLLAAEVVNGYLAGLREFINENLFTMAKRNRIFVEEQLAENKKDLLSVGKLINEFYKGDRISDVKSLIDVVLEVNEEASLEGGGVTDFGYGQEGSQAWDILEQKKGEIRKKLDETKVVEGVPQQVYLQYLILRRELLGRMNALLTQQYEMAKIDEAKEDLAFQVVDPGRIPEKRYKPKRKLIVASSFAASAFLAFFAAFFLEYINRMREESKELSR